MDKKQIERFKLLLKKEMESSDYLFSDKSIVISDFNLELDTIKSNYKTHLEISKRMGNHFKGLEEFVSNIENYSNEDNLLKLTSIIKNDKILFLIITDLNLENTFGIVEF